MPDSLAEPPAPAAVDAGPEPLPELSVEELEMLLDALDPVLDGFGSGDCCLDDASAFLARLGIPARAEAAAGQAAAGEGAESPSPPLMQWLERWRAAGGNRETLRLVVRTLLAHR